MRRILVAGIDPAFANFGIARMWLDLDTLELDLEALQLIQTEKTELKQTRVSSDDLRRAQELHGGFIYGLRECVVCFAEIPSGAKDAKAARLLGMATGVLAACPIPIIEVQPVETKLASVGTKTATKTEMIEWAVGKYPEGDWLRLNNKPGGRLLKDNEHLADAIGVVHAGIRTPDFKRLLALWHSAPVPS